MTLTPKRLRCADLNARLNPGNDDETRRLICCLWDVCERFGYEAVHGMAAALLGEREAVEERERVLGWLKEGDGQHE